MSWFLPLSFSSTVSLRVRSPLQSLSLPSSLVLPFGVNLIQNGDELQGLADSPLDGEGNPQSAEQADEQKDHAYIVVFRNKSSSTIEMVIGNGGSWTRAVMSTGITTRRWPSRARIARAHLRSIRRPDVRKPHLVFS